MERSRSMPDLWDPNPGPGDAGAAGERTDPVPGGHDEQTREVMLTDHQGRLRLPAYVLIALVVVLATVLFLTVVILLASR
jgi:hypothetical protein